MERDLRIERRLRRVIERREVSETEREREREREREIERERESWGGEVSGDRQRERGHMRE